MLFTLLHLLYIPVCIFLILVVLLQTGKRADLAGAFGGGGSQTALGAPRAPAQQSNENTARAVQIM
jgi:preprotein translocase subunit SecG